MAFMEMHYFSPALQKATSANVLLPETDEPGPYPVFYLLHGLSDDNTVWQRRTSLERYIQGLPLIVVMPDGGRGFYCDAVEGYAYETAIVRDLMGFVDRVFNTKAERAGRAIGGLSMGGYGALKLGLKFPELFCSVNSHSGATSFGHYAMQGEEAWAREFARVVGREPQGGPNDLYAITEQADAAKLPGLLIDCGADDFLIEDNRRFDAHLTKLGIPHTYREFPGVHDWAYWDEHIREALTFHVEKLGMERPGEKG